MNKTANFTFYLSDGLKIKKLYKVFSSSILDIKMLFYKEVKKITTLKLLVITTSKLTYFGTYFEDF